MAQHVQSVTCEFRADRREKVGPVEVEPLLGENALSVPTATVDSSNWPEMDTPAARELGKWL